MKARRHELDPCHDREPVLQLFDVVVDGLRRQTQDHPDFPVGLAGENPVQDLGVPMRERPGKTCAIVGRRPSTGKNNGSRR